MTMGILLEGRGDTKQMGAEGAAFTASLPSLNQRVDTATTGVIYLGFSNIGVADADPLWRICKISNTSGLLSWSWADGNSNFDNVWSDRASLTYI